MRAAFYERNGAARDVLQLGEQPTPEAGPGEVRVHLKASGINPSDVKIRNGLRQEMEYPLIIPNSDGAGIVDQVGPGVDPAWMDKFVWLHNGQRQGRAHGTAADYIALDATLICEMPDSIDFAQAATLGIPCMTAHRAVFWDGDVKNQTILVTGGAGAVGNYAIQLAKWGGARVFATVSSQAKADHAAAAGADHVYNYRDADMVERILEDTGGAGVDRIVEVDFGGNLETSLKLLKNEGVIAAYASGGNEAPALPAFPMMAKNLSAKFMVLNAVPWPSRNQAQRDITDWLMHSHARLPVAERFALEDIALAHELVESGNKLGTVVIEL